MRNTSSETSREISRPSGTCAPHRGASLSEGDCHFKGKVACPYHGWVFDGAGDCVSVLSEGPNSGIPGKVQARHYPTQTLKGMVFVWTGESEPVPSKRMSRRSFSKRAAWSSTAGPNGR